MSIRENPTAGAQKAVQRVKHRIPGGKCSIVRTYFAEYFRRIDEQKDDDFQRIGKFDFQLVFDQRRKCEEQQSEDAQHDIFKIPVENLSNHDADD